MAYQPYHQKRITAGLCKDCGSPRGEDGTSIYCRACAAKIQAKANAKLTGDPQLYRGASSEQSERG